MNEEKHLGPRKQRKRKGEPEDTRNAALRSLRGPLTKEKRKGAQAKKN